MNPPRPDALDDIYRLTAEGFGDTVIATVDEKGQLQYLNPFGRTLLGIEHINAPQATDWRKRVPVEFHAEIGQLIGRAQDRTDHEFVFDVPLITGDLRAGASITQWYRCRALRITPQPTQSAQWLLRLVDIGRRKSTEAELRTSNDRLMHAVATTSVVLSAQDESLRYVWINRPQGGLDPSRFIGYTDEDIFPLDGEGHDLHARKREVIATGIPWRGELRLTVNGIRYIFDISVSAEFDTAGTIIGVAGAAFDITAVREAAEALREIDRRKDLHLAMMAHELRNPLAPLRAMHELLALRADAPTINTREVELLGRSITQLARVVDDLLDLSSISQTRMTVIRTPTDLRTLLQQALMSTGPIAQQKQLTLALDLPEESLIADVDAQRIAQVIGNLLHNALKFTPAGGHISVSAQADAGDVQFTVSDTGMGIAAENLPRIFDLYGRFITPRTDRTAGLGLGLGLHLARELIHLHGGRIEVRSEGLGRGSAFTVYLPRIHTLLPAPSVQQRLDLPRSIPRSVLLVDDNADAVESLAMIVSTWGHPTHIALSGADGLLQAERLKPDVVILDLLMPGLSGFEVARKLRAQPWARRTVLIALSGLGQQADLERSLQAGFDRHLIKPVDPTRLREIIEAA
jgi:signal transduction histidine kinase